VIAVVGGTGVIGAAIVRALRDGAEEVVVVSHNPRRAGEPDFRYGDMRHPETLPAAFAGADVVVQTANFRNYPIERPRRGDTFMAYDGVGTQHLVTAARDAGARRYVFISGAGTREGSGRPYFEALWRGQHAVMSSGMEAVCLGPTLVFGPEDHGLNRILWAARRLPALPVLGGSQLHQPLFIDDLGSIAARACALGAPQGVFDVGGPERVTLEDMLRRLLAVARVRRPLVHVPASLGRFGATFLELLPAPPITRAAVDFLADDFVADLGPVSQAYPTRLTGLEEGLSTYIASRAVAMG
jgi:uncharacterized protein YbjT (DUF2867 family)